MVESYLYISTNNPFTFSVFEVLIEMSLVWIFNGIDEISLAAIIVAGMIHGNNPLPFHVGLVGKDEDFDGTLACLFQWFALIRPLGTDWAGRPRKGGGCERSFVDPDRHRSLFPVSPGIVRNGSQSDRTLTVIKSLALKDRHASEQLIAMLCTQFGFKRQGYAWNVHVRIINLLETIDNRAAHQCYLALVGQDFLMSGNPADRHRHV